MYQCTKCKYAVEYTTNYCPLCGSETKKIDKEAYEAELRAAYVPPAYEEEIPPAPVFENPIPQEFEYRAEQVYYAPRSQENKKNIAKRIIGMVLSIEGFAVGVFGIFYVLTLLSLGESIMSLSELTFMAAVYGGSSIPSAIVGLILSSSVAKSGDTSASCRLGRIFGIIGIVLGALLIVAACSTGVNPTDFLFSGDSAFSSYPYNLF